MGCDNVPVTAHQIAIGNFDRPSYTEPLEAIMRINSERIFIILISFCLAFSGCTGVQNASPTSTATLPPVTIPTPTATPVPLPELTLVPGEFYFRLDGTQSFLFSRNLAGVTPQQYSQILDLISPGTSRMIRLSLDSMGTGITPTGDVDETWAGKWEQVLDDAAAQGIYVIPVFSSWYDWNNGTPDFGYSQWESNAFNAANGGLAVTPAELFLADSPTQIMWLAWVQKLVERWQDRENIAAWEIFSEVNLATGPTEATGTAFIEESAALIRAADSRQRPTTASLAGFDEWSNFLRSDAIDFINIHPYPYTAQLDTFIIQKTRQYITAYHKPVLIGESGLSAATPDSNAGQVTTAENASTGISHAIWAAVVSGAMNGRALWWEDGVAIYFPELAFPFLEKYAKAELAASAFVEGMDFTGFTPLQARSSSGVTGAALGNETMVIDWFRDAACEPPDWIVRPIPAGQTVTLTVPGTAANWQVDFYNTTDGTTILSSSTVTRQGSTVTVTLPEFQDDIAFKMTAVGETVFSPVPPTSTAPAAGNTDPIAGKWAGTLTNSAGTFSTQIEIFIQQGCQTGRLCGTYSVPQLPCSGDLYLQTINDGTFVFIEQNAAGAPSCKSGGYEQLRLNSDGSLFYQYLESLGYPVISTGTLNHP